MSQSTDFIPFARPTIGTEEEAAVLRVLRSGWLTTGAETRAFEEEFGRAVGARHALAVNSATAGLHLGLEALGIGAGDRVAMSPYTFAATAEVARYLGADPVFVDIEADSFNIDPELLDTLVSGGETDVRAVIPVHIAGSVCRMNEIRDVATRSGLKLLEDAAHAFPVRYGDRFAGTLGDAGVYSFYATKTITTGEGGMVVTDDDEIAHRVGVMRLHGIDREVWNRYTEKGASWEYAVVAPGYKYNLSDIASAIGRVQLRRADAFRDRREEIARSYTETFRTRDYLMPPETSELPSATKASGPGGRSDANPANLPRHAWHLYLLRLDLRRLTITRNEYIRALADAGIGTSVHFIPLHTMPYYRDRYGYRPEDFPRAMGRFKETISLPIYPGLTDAQVERIMAAVTTIGDSHTVLGRR